MPFYPVLEGHTWGYYGEIQPGQYVDLLPEQADPYIGYSLGPGVDAIPAIVEGGAENTEPTTPL